MGIQYIFRIEYLFDPVHQAKAGLRQRFFQIRLFGKSDAVFSRYLAAQFPGFLVYFLHSLVHPLLPDLIAQAIPQDICVEIPVARMPKDVYKRQI